MDSPARAYGVEWPTLGLIALTYAAWIGLTLYADPLTLWVAVPALTLVLVMHSSLQHETIHGHPVADPRIGQALMTPGLGLAVPYGRFRDLHLDHHRDARLTDPYDDPESYYFDPRQFHAFSGPVQALLRANNTFVGRLLLGPAIGTDAFWRTERARLRAGDPACRAAWAVHLATLVPILGWLIWVASMPLWAYVLCAYAALSILKIRTFAEHQAHALSSGRSVIIEDRGPLAFLFLNNNLHSVHHAHPQVAWYDLPRLYQSRREAYLARNRGYRFTSYATVARRYFLRAKETVPHPYYDRPQPPNQTLPE